MHACVPGAAPSTSQDQAEHMRDEQATHLEVLKDVKDQATTSSDQRFGLSQQLCKRGKSPRAVVGSMRCVTHARTRGGRSNVDR